MSLLDDLKEAQAEQPCPLCEYIRELTDGPTKEALTEAAAGTIGVTRLAKIFQNNKLGFGRRTLERHRREDHKP